MIFDNSFKEQNFIKPQLGADNMFFKRSGDMTTFGRVGSTLAPLIGAAYGGKKGAEMAGSAFGALASLGMSKTAEDDLYDESLADMDKKNAIGQLVGTGVDFVNGIGKRAATAIATGGTSEVTRAASGAVSGGTTSTNSGQGFLSGLMDVVNTKTGDIPEATAAGFTPNNSIPYSSQTSVQANPITGTYMDRAKANPLANFALGKIAPIAQFKDGGILKSMKPLKKKSDPSEDIDMYDKETGEKVGEMRYDERIFSQMDTKKMEELASKGKLEQLGKLVKDSIEKQESKEQVGMIMAQDGGKPKVITPEWVRKRNEERQKRIDETVARERAGLSEDENSGTAALDAKIRNTLVSAKNPGMAFRNRYESDAARLGLAYDSISNRYVDLPKFKADKAGTMTSMGSIYGSLGMTPQGGVSPSINSTGGVQQQVTPSQGQVSATQRQTASGGASRPSNRTTGTKTAPITKEAMDTRIFSPMNEYESGNLIKSIERPKLGSIETKGALPTGFVQTSAPKVGTTIQEGTNAVMDATSPKSLMDRLKELRESKLGDNPADTNRRKGNLADSATALYQTIRGSRIDLPTFEPNAQYLEYGNRLGQMAQSGLPASQDAQLRSQLDRQSAMTMGQLANIGGGSQGAALGVLSNMAQGTQGAVAQRDLANDQAQMQALGMYGNFLGNQRNQDFAQVFAPQYEQAAADITSTAQSIAALRGNIEARNNFYNTYEDPNSPYRRMIESQISSIGRTEQNIEDESNKLPGQSGVSLYSNVLEDDDATFKALEKSRADLNARNRRVTGTRNLRTRG